MDPLPAPGHGEVVALLEQVDERDRVDRLALLQQLASRDEDRPVARTVEVGGLQQLVTVSAALAERSIARSTDSSASMLWGGPGRAGPLPSAPSGRRASVTGGSQPRRPRPLQTRPRRVSLQAERNARSHLIPEPGRLLPTYASFSRRKRPQRARNPNGSPQVLWRAVWIPAAITGACPRARRRPGRRPLRPRRPRRPRSRSGRPRPTRRLGLGQLGGRRLVLRGEDRVEVGGGLGLRRASASAASAASIAASSSSGGSSPPSGTTSSSPRPRRPRRRSIGTV